MLIDEEPTQYVCHPKARNKKLIRFFFKKLHSLNQDLDCFIIKEADFAINKLVF